jgi:hypothetical protein
VRAWACCIAIGAAASCGSSGAGALPVSGEAISCAASMYISSGQCVDLPPFSDASVDFDNDEDATSDAGISPDATPDASTFSNDASDTTPDASDDADEGS